MNPNVLKNAKEGLKKVEKVETPQLIRTPAQRYKNLEARLDEMNRSGEGSGSDPQKYEAPVPSGEGQKPPVGEGPKPYIRSSNSLSEILPPCISCFLFLRISSFLV